MISFLLKLYLLYGTRSSNDSVKNIEPAFFFKLAKLHVLLNMNSLIKSKKSLFNSALKSDFFNACKLVLGIVSINLNLIGVLIS